MFVPNNVEGQIEFVDGADWPCTDGCWAWMIASWKRLHWLVYFYVLKSKSYP